jgi:hypothetical protein
MTWEESTEDFEASETFDLDQGKPSSTDPHARSVSQERLSA